METKSRKNGFFIDNWRLALGWRLLLVGAGITGVTMNIVMMGGDIGRSLSYYTVLSNLVAVVFFAFAIFRTFRQRNLRFTSTERTIKGAVTLGVFLTFVIFHFILRPTMFTMGAEVSAYTLSLANILVHYIVPLAAAADWLLFDRKGQIRKLDPLIWTAMPLAYLAFSLIRAQFATFPNGSRYPYFFIDIDQLGIAQVALNCLLIAAAYIALGYLVFLIDRILAKISLPSRL
jgi:hypothetical protein